MLAVAGLLLTGTAASRADIADSGKMPAVSLPAQTQAEYDYPSYGPGVAGSSLSFVIGKRVREDLHPPPHAD